MTANEKRKAVVNVYKQCLGRNIYSQDGNKRECAFTPYKDGKYYSDCSSSVRLAYKRANVGLNNIGGNTVSMYGNGRKVECNIVNGIPTNVSALRVGDILLFAGNDTSRKSYEYVGHVEMVYAINGDKVTLCGHGSGNPSTKDMVTYCTKRQKTSAATPRGNRGLICVKRFIEDDVIENKPASPIITEYTDNEQILWELSNRGIISNVDLWRGLIAQNSNYYWLARKIVHYVRTKTYTEYADSTYTDTEKILWELSNRGIITNVDLWRKIIAEDNNIYWLCLKAVHYMRTQKREI